MVNQLTKLSAVLMALFMLPFVTVSAQQTPTHHNCGISADDGDLIKQRMLDNRRNKATLLSEYQTFKSTRNSADSTIYVPVQFHIVTQANGTGGVSYNQVFANLCAVNDFYEDQGVQFYIDGINEFASQQVYTNADPSVADYIRMIHRRDGVVNIYIGGPYQQGTGYGAYYAPAFDWIFAWNNQIQGGLTMAHELGHFFTLPHTFNGWEGMDFATANVGGNAPEMGTNGRPVEKVVRNAAGENCQWAADGFCDTPADYASDGGGCTFTYSWNDPDGTPINSTQNTPMIDNHMSYFSCRSRFSEDQKDAIKLDVLNRGYQFTPVPEPLAVDGTPTIAWPENGALAPYTTNAIEMTWNAPAAANRYLVTIERTINNGQIPTGDIQRFFTSDTRVWANLQPNTEYTWKVEAMTAYDPCTNTTTSTPATFTTADWTVNTTATAMPVNSSKVFPNPNTGDDVMVAIDVNQTIDATISITNALGQQVLPAQPVTLNAGNHVERLNVSTLAAGMYIVNIETGSETISHKLIIQK